MSEEAERPFPEPDATRLGLFELRLIDNTRFAKTLYRNKADYAHLAVHDRCREMIYAQALYYS